MAAQAYGQANPSDVKDTVDKLVAILKSDAPQKEKADACRQLAQVGTKDAVAPLAELLGNEKLSHMARFAMETIPDPAVDDALRNALGHLQGRPLIGVMGSIGVRHDAKAVELLAKHLQDSDADAAQAAARALGKIGNQAAAKAIDGALPNTPAANQLAFCEGLLRCAESLSANGQRDEAIRIYDRLLAISGPHQVRTAAVRGAILTRQKEGLSLLQQSLRNDDYLVFAAAVRTTYETPDIEVTPVMTAQLSQLPADRQVLLIQALGNRRDGAALPALITAAKGGAKPVQAAAITAMVAIGDAAAVPALLGLMANADKEIAQQAKEGFASFPGQAADAAVVAMLGAEQANQRLTGIDLVGRRRMLGCIAALLKATGDADSKVRLAAMRQLGELASPAELPALVDLLMQTKESQGLNALEQAIAGVCNRAEDAESCAQKLIARMAQAQVEQKVAILRLLSGIGGTESLKAIRTTVTDTSADARVRATAIRSLGTWKTAEVAPDLLTLAKDGTSPADRLLGLRAYLTMAARSSLAAEQRLSMCREAQPLVQRDEEKRLLLAALDSIASLDAIDLATPYLDNAGTKEEASAAIVSIAQKLVKGQDAAAMATKLRQPLEKVAQVSGNADVTRQAKALLRRVQGQGSGR
ncbi:MAG: HEAT repeat domain-containing protein [Bacillota bacterium]